LQNTATPVFPQQDPSTEGLLRTHSVRLGEQILYSVDASEINWSILGNTAQLLLNERFGLLEHHEARAAGVEVSWVLAQKPAGNGPLEIALELTGLQYAGESEQGFHFADAAGTSRVRVGPVHVVSASGETHRVSARVNGEALLIIVPKELVTGMSFPVAIDP